MNNFNLSVFASRPVISFCTANRSPISLSNRSAWRWLQPLATPSMPLDARPPRGHPRSPLVLSRVHWVRPELVAEVKFLTRAVDNLLRQVVYEGLPEDTPAREVRREIAHPVPAVGNLARSRLFH